MTSLTKSYQTLLSKRQLSLRIDDANLFVRDANDRVLVRDEPEPLPEVDAEVDSGKRIGQLRVCKEDLGTDLIIRVSEQKRKC